MKKSSSPTDNFDLWVLIAQTRDALFKVRQKELSQRNISVMKVAVLFFVRQIGNRATPAEISRWIFRQPHSVSGLLSRMEKEGLVRKVKDLDKKNMVRVTLTEKGEQAYYRSLERDSVNRVISSLSEEECQQLRPILRKLRAGALTELGMDQRPLLPHFDKSA